MRLKCFVAPLAALALAASAAPVAQANEANGKTAAPKAAQTSTSSSSKDSVITLLKTVKGVKFYSVSDKKPVKEPAPKAKASYVQGQPFFCDHGAWIASWTASMLSRCSFSWSYPNSLFLCTKGGRYVQVQEWFNAYGPNRRLYELGGCDPNAGWGNAWVAIGVY